MRIRSCLAYPWFLAILVLGCAGTDDPMLDDAETEVPEDGKADQLGLSGTFNLDDDEVPEFGDILSLTLNADGTFERAVLGRCTEDGEGEKICTALMDQGSFRLTRGRVTGRTYITFYDVAELRLDKHEYMIDAETLQLRRTWTKRWMSYVAVSTGPTPPAPGECPDPDPPEGSVVTCHMQKFLRAYLRAAGYPEDAMVVDARDLRRDEVADWLVARGFSEENPPGNGARSFELGEAALYSSGQRALVYEDGRRELVTFAQNRQNGASFVESIALASDGTVTGHTVSRLP